MKDRRGMQSIRSEQPCVGPLTINGYSVVPQLAVEDSYVLNLASALMDFDPNIDRMILGETVLKYASSELTLEEWWALWGEELAELMGAGVSDEAPKALPAVQATPVAPPTEQDSQPLPEGSGEGGWPASGN